MPKFRGAHAFACLPLVCLGGCSWSRFDDVSQDSPVVALKKPGQLEAGFGDGLATLDSDTSVQLLSMGTSPRSRGATFELGTGENPVIDAMDVGHCETTEDDVCASVTTPVGLALAAGPGEDFEMCFISGIGALADSHGLMLRCADDTQFELPVPAEVDAELIEPMLEGELVSDSVTLAVDRATAPAVLAGVPLLGMAFYYAPLSRTPVELELPGADPDDTHGATLAVLETGSDGRVFAVGAPGAGQVWLYRMTDAGSSTRGAPIGCIGGISAFGRALAAGRVDDDAIDDLVVSDEKNVSVLSGKVLAELPETNSTSCSFASLPEGGLLASFSCGSEKGVSGCSDSAFGQTLAVGDLDGDSDGEVVVGAPRMTVRDQAGAGALVIYDVEGDEPHAFSQVLFASSVEANDRLGNSLATPNLGERHIIAAGAPGGSKTYLFYCPELLGASRSGLSRCH